MHKYLIKASISSCNHGKAMSSLVDDCQTEKNEKLELFLLYTLWFYSHICTNTQVTEPIDATGGNIKTQLRRWWQFEAPCWKPWSFDDSRALSFEMSRKWLQQKNHPLQLCKPDMFALTPTATYFTCFPGFESGNGGKPGPCGDEIFEQSKGEDFHRERQQPILVISPRMGALVNMTLSVASKADKFDIKCGYKETKKGF